MVDFSPEEQAALELLRKNADAVPPDSARNFPEAVESLMRLWEDHHRSGRAWSPDFVEEAARLLRKEGNRHGFTAYFGACRRYSLRRRGDGFVSACYLRSKIQILTDEFVPFADFMHPADSGALEKVDKLYIKDANDIAPIPPEEIPWWVPESHWWWRAPTRLDMSQQEIDEKIHDYSLSDFYDEDEEMPGETSQN
ncbi:hypothetical protein KGD82_03305 [Nocardiopsis eucommiae]|uniref:Uncharacterized protein n=1 Tax=Nocardiopsis eucommiae TaxID=2831970 RepID=A0A975LA66_9ACTN|nr:hypothetical protein KGD82_03305 [Nocardiopsis eucommiae]